MTLRSAETSRPNSSPLRLLLAGIGGGLLAAGGLLVLHYTDRVERTEERIQHYEAMLSQMREQQSQTLSVLAQSIKEAKSPTVVIPQPAAIRPSLSIAPPLKLSEVVKNTERIEAKPESNKITVDASTSIPASLPPLKPGAEADGKLCGRILSVQARQGRILMEGGRSNGLTGGKRFSIWRGEEFIAEVCAEEVFRDLTVCKVLSTTDAPLRIGDRVHQAGDLVSLANGDE